MDELEEIKKILKELAISQKDTDRRFKETDRKFKETDEELKKLAESIKELSKNIGGLNASFGKIPEALSIPGIEEIFRKWEINVIELAPDVKRIYDNGRKTKEIDLILKSKLNGEFVIIVIETQVRYKNTKEVDKFYNFVTNEFKQIFNEYKEYKVGGCVCALEFGKGVDLYAIKKGFFVLKPVKGIMGIINPKGFIPTLV